MEGLLTAAVWLSTLLPAPGSTCDAPFLVTARSGSEGDSAQFLLATPTLVQGSVTFGLVAVLRRDSSRHGLLLLASDQDRAPSILADLDLDVPSARLFERDPDAGNCLLADRSPWLRVTAEDLDADGRWEVVIETNEAGTCARCLSRVRVLQFDERGARVVVDEPFSHLEMSRGEGIRIDSWVRGRGDRIVPVSKTFFAPG